MADQEVDICVSLVVRVVGMDTAIMLVVGSMVTFVGIVGLMLGATAPSPGSMSNGEIDRHSPMPELVHR